MTLTKQRAQQRYAAIQPESVNYKFHLLLESGSNYKGISQIQFGIRSIPEQFVLDCKAQKVTKLVINGKQIQKIQHEDGFLTLDCTALKQGQNQMVIVYNSKYDNDGNGCVSFVDVDNKQYIYTQFQPYYANRVFALLDQPDIKAPMSLSVIYPSSFQKVISNEFPIADEIFNIQRYVELTHANCKQLLEELSKDFEGRMSIFNKTNRLSTYLYCFIAGPYKKLQLKQTYRNIPMSLYCIQSLFSQMQGMAEFVSQVTNQCMKFFQQFFGVPYPFSKYDQVFAHQYKCGAMENAGIVTLNDEYIWKEKVSIETMLDLANTISHELSHHWFGNLCTMKWWDDLWLNESFAEFISHYCLQQIKANMKTIKYQSSMAAFLARKAWGYHEDQLATTHPISGQVENTMVAVSIFDGITYSKGAATMKQLLLLMGEKNFSAGLCCYFKKYGFKNATLEDFINQLQSFFKSKELTLSEWRKLWLETASLNQLQAKWSPLNLQKDAKLEVLQTPFDEKYPTLRPHKIKIALFKKDCTYDVLEIMVKPQKVTTITYDGTNQYKAVLLNYEDHTFAKIIIDEASLNFFSSSNLVKIQDTLTRTLIWRSFYDMVKDSKISSLRYIDIFQANIANEKSDSIFENHFIYVNAAINSYTPQKYRLQLSTRIFYFILSFFLTQQNLDQNRVIILKSQLGKFAQGLTAVRILLAWREKKYGPLQDQQMSIVQKWKAVVLAFAQKSISNQQKLKLLVSQLQLDSSDTGKLEQAVCKSLIANDQEFEQLYQIFKNPKSDKSVSLKAKMMAGWNHEIHTQKLKKYKIRYFDELPQISKQLQEDNFDAFLQGLLPIDDNLQQTIDMLKNVKFGDQKQYDKIKIDVIKLIGDLQRRQKAYAKFEEFHLV